MTSTHSADANQQYENDGSSKVELIIHHRFPGIELVSPIYFETGAKCYLSPDQEVYFGSTTQVGFTIDSDKSKSTGILIYELPEENAYNASCIRIFILWEVNNSKEFRVNSFLIEHEKNHFWDKDRLMQLTKWHPVFNIQHIPIEDTWLMHDDRVLMKRLSVTHEEECYKLEMTISETSIRDDTRILEYISTLS
jgi:hypothetical protein